MEASVTTAVNPAGNPIPEPAIRPDDDASKERLAEGWGVVWDSMTDAWQELYLQAADKGNPTKTCLHFANSLEGREPLGSSANPTELAQLVKLLSDELREMRQQAATKTTTRAK